MKSLESVWGFLSIFVIAWLTQRIIAHWERRKKIEETKLALYMSWLPFLSEAYASAVYPAKSTVDEYNLFKKEMEILASLQLMGPGKAIDLCIEFCNLARKGLRKDPSFDFKSLHYSFTALNGELCCEIHSEKSVEKAETSLPEPSVIFNPGPQF